MGAEHGERAVHGLAGTLSGVARASGAHHDRSRRAFATSGALLFLLGACGGGDARSSASTGDSGTASTSPAVRDCGGTTTIDENGIGALRVHATVAQVRAACEVLRDTMALTSEGMTARTLLVRVGVDSVASVVVNDRVQSISIESPRFRTADSLGVGTPVSRLLAQPGAEVFGGEGNVAISTASHCGMSFLLPREIAGKFPIPTVEGLRGLPASASIARVLVFPCAGTAEVPAGTTPPEVAEPPRGVPAVVPPAVRPPQ